MTWPLEDVSKLSVATGRRLLRVGAAGDDELELVFERKRGEKAELLVTVRMSEPLAIGRIDLPVVEENFGLRYGLGVER